MPEVIKENSTEQDLQRVLDGLKGEGCSEERIKEIEEEQREHKAIYGSYHIPVRFQKGAEKRRKEMFKEAKKKK